MSMASEPWWRSDKGCVHSNVLKYVKEVERQQADLFDRFIKLAYLYDPNDREHLDSYRRRGPDSQVTENVIASNIDTVFAVTASTSIRPRFMTDDADWSTQRRARHLGWYSEGLMKQYDVMSKCRRAFKDAALKGTGVIKVYVDRFGDLRVERCLIDDIIVDNGEARGKEPTQLHHRHICNADELASRWPEHADAIEAAQRAEGTAERYWADYRPVDRDDVVVIESWKLPIGKQGKKGFIPGRHTICIDGLDLVDEEWEWDFFPFAVARWSERDAGWYGLSLAERIVGHQRQLNKMHWQIDRQMDQHAVPTTYVKYPDANLAVKTTNRAGTIVPVKADYPLTVIPKAVGEDQWRRLDQVSMKAGHETGVNQMAMHGAKPGGLDSGQALREYKDQTTQRFAPQEIELERLTLRTVELMLWCCKMMDEPPEPVRQSKFGRKRIKWVDVEMSDIRVQIAAASDLARTPAGRVQLALEWAQAGIISQDEARRLLQHPDTERSMSLYTAALEDIERTMEEMLDGAVLVPEPYQNLKMGVWRMQQGILKARDDGAPEDVLEVLRNWVVQAAEILAMSQMPAQPMAGAEAIVPGEAAPADPMAAAAGPAPIPGAGVTPAELMQ